MILGEKCQTFSSLVYRSSNNRLYYLHGGESLPNGLNLYTFNESSENALTSIPSGYIIVERKNSESIPALVSIKHTREKNTCQWEEILDLAEQSDTQFYLSNIGDPQWNEARKSAIVKMIGELENISKIVTCAECQKEIKWQIELQRDGTSHV